MCHVLTKSDEQAKSIRCRSDLICLSFRICIKKPLLLPGEVDVIVILAGIYFLRRSARETTLEPPLS